MLFRLTVAPLSPPADPVSAERWKLIEKELREKLPRKLRARLIETALHGYDEEVHSTGTVKRFLSGNRRSDFSQIRVRVLSVVFGSVEVFRSVEALISVAGAKIIAAALATALPGAAEVITSVAKETVRDLLQERLAIAPSARVDAELVDDAEDEQTESIPQKASNPARAASLVGAILLGLFALAYYSITETGEHNKTVQAFFADARDHAKAVDQLEVDLIKARSELLKLDTTERSELHKLLVSLAIERSKAMDQRETDLIKVRSEMLSGWASLACCTSQPCPPKPINHHTRLTKQSPLCPPTASAVRTANQE